MAGTRQGLRENERSIREAKCVKSLTLAGLIFIPLIYTSGLFSMNDRYASSKPFLDIFCGISTHDARSTVGLSRPGQRIRREG